MTTDEEIWLDWHRKNHYRCYMPKAAFLECMKLAREDEIARTKRLENALRKKK